jgi:hypothetical protein
MVLELSGVLELDRDEVPRYVADVLEAVGEDDRSPSRLAK